MFISSFRAWDMHDLRDLGTEQVHQILHASIAITRSCWREERIHHFFRHGVIGKKFEIGYVKGATDNWHDHETRIVKYALARVRSQRIILLLQSFFHSLMPVENCIGK